MVGSRLAGCTVLAATGLIAFLARAADVSVNGAIVPKATSTIDSTQDITEFRVGGDPAIRLLPASKRYGVCVVAPAPVAVLDGELPVADSPDRFTVQVEDGRTFGRCVLASLKADGSGGKRRFTYCLRCEDVTTP